MLKKLSYFGCWMLFLLLFVACSNDDVASEKDEQDSGNDKEISDNFNKEGLPIVDEKVSLHFVSPKAPLAPDYNEMEIIQRLEDKTNVHIEWDNISGDGYEERKNLMFASDELPDAFYHAEFSDYDIVRYGRSGQIIPLEDLIEEHAPNLQKIFEKRPELKSMVTAPDGHIYSLPRAEEMGLVAVPNFTSINTKWLDELGLDMPTTLEEYGDVLRAFRDQDPNNTGEDDVIPLSYMHNFWTGNFGDMFAAFGVPDNTEHRIVRDGEVIFTATQPEYKEAIEYFHGWVEEGLIDDESFIQDVSQYFAKGKTDPPTLGSYIWWETEEIVGPERSDDYELLPPLEGPNGHKIVGRSNNSEYSRGAFAITSANEHPEITMRWVDQIYDPKMSAQMSWGPIGIIYEEDENGMLVNKELEEGVAMGELRQKVAPNGPTVVLEEDFGTVVDMEPRAKQRLKDIQEIYEPYLEEESFPQIFFSEEELDQINRLEVDILEFVNQKQASWLLNGGVEEEWDSYIQQLESMGLHELMQIYQDGLDRFNENL
ncbi:ABC transporter substrate-binding protein [Gracilibacillus sp. YIM 98692]|uniref:ABC transporter substrate-binding protein n=1 Tax=Gracilibacillus sp. YIM 98692 TaxID=2663532 RepID=UPI001F096D9A|nr:ABC transporter substrate-binding protein [Gracilibacillus sp. YIM 98692]